jgi:chitinase
VTISPTKSTAGSSSTPKAYPKPDVEDRNGYRTVGYYGNWVITLSSHPTLARPNIFITQDIYARKFFPSRIPATKLTHVLYSFADNTADGTITFSDPYADTDIHFASDSWSDKGNNVYGAMKQLGLLKQQNRNLKVMLSIGGWTYTNEKKHLDPVGESDTATKKFAASCVDMIKNYGFDGIDVDWEYPQDEEQGKQFLALLRAIRAALDAYAKSLAKDKTYAKEAQPHFLLSIAAPAGAENYGNLPLKDVADELDFINLMVRI